MKNSDKQKNVNSLIDIGEICNAIRLIAAYALPTDAEEAAAIPAGKVPPTEKLRVFLFSGDARRDVRNEAEGELHNLVRAYERLQAENVELKKTADFLRQSVGECHLMISRNTAIFQLDKKDWDETTLPSRVSKLILDRVRLLRMLETAADALRDDVGRTNGR